MNRKATLATMFLALMCALALVARPRAQEPEETKTEIEVPTQPQAWLHVEVETSYSWFHQKSKGRAWVTVGKNDSTRVKVGKLCISLAAHDQKDSCAANADEIVISEKRRGVQIRKRTAIVSAWTDQPVLDTVIVKMEP